MIIIIAQDLKLKILENIPTMDDNKLSKLLSNALEMKKTKMEENGKSY